MADFDMAAIDKMCDMDALTAKENAELRKLIHVYINAYLISISLLYIIHQSTILFRLHCIARYVYLYSYCR